MLEYTVSKLSVAWLLTDSTTLSMVLKVGGGFAIAPQITTICRLNGRQRTSSGGG